MPKSSTVLLLFSAAKDLLKEKRRFMLSGAVATTTGLFLVFAVFTAPLFSMIAFPPPGAGGGGFTQWVVVDGANNNPYQLIQQAYAQDGEPEVPEGGEGAAEPLPPPTTEEEEEEEQPPPPQPLTASMNIDSTNGDTAPATFLFETFPEGGTEPYAFSWDFGDGSSQSNEQNTEHTFVNPGTYVVSLTVSDSIGQTASDREEVIVRPATTTTGPATPPSPPAAGSNATLVGNQSGGGEEVAVQPEPIGPGGVVERCVSIFGRQFCFGNLEPDTNCITPINVEDPPLCIRGSIVIPGPTSTICTPTAGGTAANTTLNQGVDQNTNQTGGEAGLAVNDPGAEGPKVKPTKREGGNQSIAEVDMLIEEACMALQNNNDTQGAQIQLNLVLYASVISPSNVTTTAGGGANNATGGVTTAEAAETAGVNQTQAPIVLEVQGTPGETIEDVQQKMIEEINSDPRLTPEQKTQAINQLSAEVAQQQQEPQVERAACHLEIRITFNPFNVWIGLVDARGNLCELFGSDITPSNETGGETEAAPDQTTTEQGDPIPGLEAEN